MSEMTKEDAKQLRIGNYLQRLDDSIFQVSAQDILSISKWERNEYPSPKFIPLSEDILLRCGFEGRDDFKWNSRIGIKTKDGKYFIAIKSMSNVFFHTVTEVKFLHHIQNIAFDFGTELTLNP